MSCEHDAVGNLSDTWCSIRLVHRVQLGRDGKRLPGWPVLLVRSAISVWYRGGGGLFYLSIDGAPVLGLGSDFPRSEYRCVALVVGNTGSVSTHGMANAVESCARGRTQGQRSDEFMTRLASVTSVSP